MDAPPVRVFNLQADGFSLVDCLVSNEIIRRLVAWSEGLPTDTNAVVRRNAPFARRNLLDDPEIQSLATQDAIRRVVEPLLGADAIAVRAILFDKTPDANWTVPWHQDRSIAVRERRDVHGFGPWSQKAGVVHVQPPADVLRSMLTVRLHLDPCDADNGPLRVIAGTHHDVLDAKTIDDLVSRSEEILCCVPAGGAVLMRPLILHASSPARSARHRRVIHIEFAAGPLPHGLEWRFDA